MIYCSQFTEVSSGTLRHSVIFLRVKSDLPLEIWEGRCRASPVTFAWQSLEAQSITGWGEHLSPEAKSSWNDGGGGPLVVPDSWEDQPPKYFL